jgi:hypothetical protein
MLRQSALHLRARPRSTMVAKPSTIALAKPFKPWPYNLPEFLRPQAGTTYGIQYGHASVSPKQDLKPIGVLQAILYGRPDPNEKITSLSSLRQDGFVYKVLHGVKEGEKAVAAGVKVAGARK